MLSLWDLRRTWRANAGRLSGVKHYRFATLGLKEVGGKVTRERCLKIYVSRKVFGDAAELSEGERVPPDTLVIGRDGGEVGAVRTDVCRAPKPYTGFGIRSGHIVLGFDHDKGVSALSFRAGGFKFLVTNAHVVVDIASGGVFGQVSIVDRATGQRHVVGDVVHATPLRPNARSDEDLAIVRVFPAFQVDDFMALDTVQPIDRNQFDGIRSATATEYSYNVGGTIFRAARAEPVMGFAPVRVDGVIVNYSRCWLLHMTHGTGVPGHSGALLYRVVGGVPRACGLVFAGSAANRTILAYPFAPIATEIERRLGAPIN